MMMGPEPTTRMRWRSARRGMWRPRGRAAIRRSAGRADQVVDNIAHRPGRLPACGVAQLRVVPDQRRHIDGADERGLRREWGLYSRRTQYLHREILERDA